VAGDIHVKRIEDELVIRLSPRGTQPSRLPGSFGKMSVKCCQCVRTEVMMPARQISVQVQNFDYNRDN
jgi:hypothetical protein